MGIEYRSGNAGLLKNFNLIHFSKKNDLLVVLLTSVIESIKSFFLSEIILPFRPMSIHPKIGKEVPEQIVNK